MGKDSFTGADRRSKQRWRLDRTLKLTDIRLIVGCAVIVVSSYYGLQIKVNTVESDLEKKVTSVKSSLDKRVIRIETNVEFIKNDIQEQKVMVKSLDSKFDKLRDLIIRGRRFPTRRGEVVAR